MDLSQFSRQAFSKYKPGSRGALNLQAALELALVHELRTLCEKRAGQMVRALNQQGHLLEPDPEVLFGWHDTRREDGPSLKLSLLATVSCSAELTKPRTPPTSKEAEGLRLTAEFTQILNRAYAALAATPPAPLKRDEHLAYRIFQLQSQVNNGGFSQFFYNVPPKEVAEIADVLTLVGAHQMAALLGKALAVGGKKGRKPRPAQEEQWRVLDQAFWKLQENPEALLLQHLAALPHQRGKPRPQRRR